jgi:hypothetical protein
LRSKRWNGQIESRDHLKRDNMSDWTTEYLNRKNLEDQLEFCRSKKKQLEEHVKYMCEYKESYNQMFTERLDVAAFRAQRYKDEASYELHARMLKMWNALRYLLDDCK